MLARSVDEKLKICSLCFVNIFSAEQAGRASIMGAFLRPDSVPGHSSSTGALGRRGSDPRRTTPLEQQHLSMVSEMRHERRGTKSGGRSREPSATINEGNEVSI